MCGRQLAELLSDIGFIPVPLTVRQLERVGGRNSDGIRRALEDTPMNARSDDLEVLKALLVAALYPNIVKVQKSIQGKGCALIVKDDESVAIHPSSIHKKTQKFDEPFLVYLEKVKTSRVFIRDATPVSPLPLALFGGPLVALKGRQRKSKKIKEVALSVGDSFVTFQANEKVSFVLLSTRLALDEILDQKIQTPSMDLGDLRLIDALVSMISSRGTRAH